jgi:hypothetical protein
MSQENVEVVRRSTDAYNRGDIDGMLENWAQGAVVDWSNSRRFDAGIFRGHEEIRAFMEQFLAAWDEVWIEIVDGPGSRGSLGSPFPREILRGRCRRNQGRRRP